MEVLGSPSRSRLSRFPGIPHTLSTRTRNRNSNHAMCSVFDQAFNARLAPKLKAFDQVCGDLEKEGVQVPGVVVCGSQSAGKSSVLSTSLTSGFLKQRTPAPAAPRLSASPSIHIHISSTRMRSLDWTQAERWSRWTTSLPSLIASRTSLRSSPARSAKVRA